MAAIYVYFELTFDLTRTPYILYSNHIETNPKCTAINTDRKTKTKTGYNAVYRLIFDLAQDFLYWTFSLHKTRSDERHGRTTIQCRRDR